MAFYAVGAYTVALLTSSAEYGIAGWSFWQAIPFAVLFAMLFGLILGLPILRIRGDYLAIATLGFGEIIRILAGSDLLKPWLGGPRGILNIPKPIDVPPTHWLAGPVQIYYIALACAAVVAFVAWRLRGSRLGRSWMAIREDEDVAEGMGVNLVQTKLLAYMLGGGFAGLAGGISAAWSDRSSPRASSCSSPSTSWRSSSSAAWAASRASSWAPSSSSACRNSSASSATTGCCSTASP